MRTVTCHILKVKRSPYWQLKFRCGNETKYRRKSLGVRDKQTAEKLMSEFIIEQEREAVGLIPSKYEIENSNQSIAFLVEEYRNDLRAEKRKEDYVKTTCQQVMSPSEYCGWERVSDITAESFKSWRARNPRESSPRTLNHYLVSLKSFLNWLVRHEKHERNQLGFVQALDASDDVRRKRRAFTDDEIVRFINAAPSERQIVYKAAFHTGIRREELFSLEWRDLLLTHNPPVALLRAETTKNSRAEHVCLHPELVAALTAYKPSDSKPADKVFVFMSRMTKFKQDLKAAGIVYKNEFNEYADFHSMRHTCNTRMAANGVPLAIRQKQMRHSDPKLTACVYLDDNVLPVGDHVNSQPSLLPEQVSHIVSHGSVPEGQDASQSDTETNQVDTKKPLINQGLSHDVSQSDTVSRNVGNGSCTWDRTKDLVINSHPLYR